MEKPSDLVGRRIRMTPKCVYYKKCVGGVGTICQLSYDNERFYTRWDFDKNKVDGGFLLSRLKNGDFEFVDEDVWLDVLVVEI